MEETVTMCEVKFFSGETIPLEMHKVRIVQKLNLLPVEERLRPSPRPETTRFCCETKTVYLVCSRQRRQRHERPPNGGHDGCGRQLRGSATYYRWRTKSTSSSGQSTFLPAHQGRACESILAEALSNPATSCP
jgi:tryptophanase